MAETNPLTEALGKITGALGTAANVGQTSTYTPPDPIADMLAATKAAYAAPVAPTAVPVQNAYTTPAATPAAAPTTAREYLARAGTNIRAYRGMAPGAEARALKEGWKAIKPAPSAEQAASQLASQYAASPAVSLEEWNKANNFAPDQSFYIGQEWGPQFSTSDYTHVKSPTVMTKSYSPYQMYLNEYNAAKMAGAAPISAKPADLNKAEDYYYYTLGAGAPQSKYQVPTW